MLRFDDIVFGYHGVPAGGRALDGVSLQVASGEQVAVVGANGSGKSTLARMANGILLPNAGTVTIDGMSTDEEERIRDIRQRVGMVSQHPDDQIVATSVEDDVAFGPENLGVARDQLRERVDAALAAVGLTGFEAREPHLLSGGQKQRLGIAGALAMQPAYLVLDEPTSMLDPEGRADVLRIVAELVAGGRGILHITHDLADIASADRVVVLDAGRVAFSGPVAELFGRHDVLAACGLELPRVSILAARLSEGGASARASATTPESLVEALWR
ncbi:MAG: energy-coupling factor transporter ATPase [Coriobacteriia bacterium]|nr:energy-coupling factor transporter ATPase [Coriobacteriia bacterium]